MLVVLFVAFFALWAFVYFIACYHIGKYNACKNIIESLDKENA
jgi:hypothetical protein